MTEDVLSDVCLNCGKVIYLSNNYAPPSWLHDYTHELLCEDGKDVALPCNSFDVGVLIDEFANCHHEPVSHDEFIRLECLSAAVKYASGSSNNLSSAVTVEVAKRFEAYIKGK